MAAKKIKGTAIVKAVNAKAGGLDLSLTRVRGIQSADPLIQLSIPKAKDRVRINFTIEIPDPDQMELPGTEGK